jgi:ankyrin repeat protein
LGNYLPVLTSFAAVMTANAASSGLPLVDTIKDGNPKAVAALVAHVDLNAKGPDGSTALAWAVYKDDAVTVDLLLKAGADIDYEVQKSANILQRETPRCTSPPNRGISIL